MARPMVSGLAPPIDFDHGMRKGARVAQGGLIPDATDSVNRGVLEKQEGVGDFAGGAGGDKFLLEGESILVGNLGTEPTNVHGEGGMVRVVCGRWRRPSMGRRR